MFLFPQHDHLHRDPGPYIAVESLPLCLPDSVRMVSRSISPHPSPQICVTLEVAISLTRSHSIPMHIALSIGTRALVEDGEEGIRTIDLTHSEAALHRHVFLSRALWTLLSDLGEAGGILPTPIPFDQRLYNATSSQDARQSGK